MAASPRFTVSEMRRESEEGNGGIEEREGREAEQAWGQFFKQKVFGAVRHMFPI